MRPPGYEPGELPTAPLRDVESEVSLICGCKGTTFFSYMQIFMHFFWRIQIKGVILHTVLPMCKKYVNIKDKTTSGRCSPPTLRQERA